MKPYKFTKEAIANPPNFFERYEDESKPLNRAEKDYIADKLYGIFSDRSPLYKFGGWCWNFKNCKHFTRILVRFDGRDCFDIFYAPDKTSLRKALERTNSIKEMIYAPELKKPIPNKARQIRNSRKEM